MSVGFWRGWVVVAMLGLLVSPASAAYREVHATGYDMRARVDEAGVAQMEHSISYRVVAGSLTSIELEGIEPSASVDSTATITAEDGRTMSGQVTFQPPAAGTKDATIHVDVLEKKGLRRGIYVFKVRYRLDLAAEKAIVKEGALWRINWTSPALSEGIDGERVVFDLPAAPTEPRAEGILSTLRRSAERDELEIVRLHVARGERVTWGARVDPKAFPAVRSQELRPPAPPPAPTPDRLHDGVRAACIALVGIAFAFVFTKKTKRVSALLSRALPSEGRAIERPLLPLSRPLRIALASACVAGGVALQMADDAHATWSGALLACAIFAAAYRSPRVVLRPRGPGSWSTVREREAFGQPPGDNDILDASTRAGKVIFGLAALAIAAGAYFAGRAEAWGAGGGRAVSYLILLDGLVLVPLFFTGTRAQLPRGPHASAPWLKSVFAALKKHASALRIVPWARHPVGSESPDELRLLVLPRASMPGVVGIEIGATWAAVSHGPYLSPEVLVRVHDASAAAAKLLVLAPEVRPLPGRKPTERVVRLTPDLPTRSATRDLVLSLVRDLVDRRAPRPSAAWEGTDRRLPPAERTRATQEAPAPAA